MPNKPVDGTARSTVDGTSRSTSDPEKNLSDDTLLSAANPDEKPEDGTLRSTADPQKKLSDGILHSASDPQIAVPQDALTVLLPGGVHSEEDDKEMPRPNPPVISSQSSVRFVAQDGARDAIVAGEEIVAAPSLGSQLAGKGHVAAPPLGSQYVPSASARELVDKILECEPDDIIYILQAVQDRTHPDIRDEAVLSKGSKDLVTAITSMKPAVRDRMLELNMVSGQSSKHFTTGSGNALPRSLSMLDEMPIVQFSNFMYFCMENENLMTIDVMRVGNLEGRSVVSYATHDATARAGHKYTATSGQLIFEPHQNQSEIQVPILQNDRWETTLEFVIELSHEGLENAILGLYLYRARVKIIDDDSFPTNKFRDLILADDLDQVPKQALLLEYFKMSWQDPEILRSTIKMVAVDQVKNLFFLLQLFVGVYQVDYVLNEEYTEDGLLISPSRFTNLIFIVVLTLLPLALSHGIDYVRLDWELSPGELQRNLLRKFLNYDEDARAQLREGNLIMGMIRDSVKLIDGGYMQLIDLSASLGKLFMIMVYQFVSPLVFDQTDSFGEATFWVFSFGPLVILPLFLITFMRFRRNKNTRILLNRNDREDDLINHVYQTTENYRLIADYNRRPVVVNEFQERIDSFDEACGVADQVLLNNTYFREWVTFIMLSSIILGLGNRVTHGYPLGMFLVNLQVCESVGQCWEEIYEVMLNMEKTLPALVRMTWLMNLRTDVVHRMKLNRLRRNSTKARREEIRKSGQTDRLPIDMLRIQLKDIHFSYQGKGRETVFHFNGNLDIPQGSLTALVGHKGDGKSTVLKILGGVILPNVSNDAFEAGQVYYVPSHLRILHVSTEPMFFHGSLRENLIFGVSRKPGASAPDHPDADPERVKKICQLLRLPDDVIDFHDSDQSLDWDEVFSQTQLALLSLARALISNPEVLCIHKPTLFLDVKTSALVLEILSAFVEMKGIGQDQGKFHVRRPRTCICTIARLEALRSANQVYLVEKHGIRRIPWTSVTPDLLE